MAKISALKQEKETEPTTGAKKSRGTFPRLPLKKVMELVKEIQDEGQGDPVRRREILEKMGRSADSSTSVHLIQAANKGYGLIAGNKNSSHLELTELGAKTTTSSNQLVIFDILFSNNFFAAVVEKFKDKALPSDSIAVDFLVRDHKMDSQDAITCWSIIKENMSDYGLLKESGNKKVVIDREYAESLQVKEKKDSIIEPDVTEEEPELVEKTTPPEKSKIEKTFKNIPQITFNIQVVLPENASPEVYDSIFASMSNHLLGRED